MMPLQLRINVTAPHPQIPLLAPPLIPNPLLPHKLQRQQPRPRLCVTRPLMLCCRLCDAAGSGSTCNEAKRVFQAVVAS